MSSPLNVMGRIINAIWRDGVPRNDPWVLAIAILPATYVLSMPLFQAFHQYHQKVTDNFILATLNHVFVADYGYLWFTVAYFGWLFTYQSNWRIPNDKTLLYFRDWSVNTVVCCVFNVWCFGPSLVDRLNVATGGHCENASYKNERTCWSSGAQWIAGFDASSHYYLISSITLMLLSRLLRRERDLRKGSQYASLSGISISSAPPVALDDTRPAATLTFRIFYAVQFYLSLTLMLIWYSQFLVTSIFFHTFLEKFVGLLLGLAVPLVIGYPYS